MIPPIFEDSLCIGSFEPPFFPASVPATGSFNGIHAKTKFLATLAA